MRANRLIVVWLCTLCVSVVASGQADDPASASYWLDRAKDACCQANDDTLGVGVMAALVDAYAKADALDDAEALLDEPLAMDDVNHLRHALAAALAKAGRTSQATAMAEQIDDPRTCEAAFLSVGYHLVRQEGGLVRAQRLADRLEEPARSAVTCAVVDWLVRDGQFVEARQQAVNVHSELSGLFVEQQLMVANLLEDYGDVRTVLQEEPSLLAGQDPLLEELAMDLFQEGESALAARAVEMIRGRGYQAVIWASLAEMAAEAGNEDDYASLIELALESAQGEPRPATQAVAWIAIADVQLAADDPREATQTLQLALAATEDDAVAESIASRMPAIVKLCLALDQTDQADRLAQDLPAGLEPALAAVYAEHYAATEQFDRLGEFVASLETQREHVTACAAAAAALAGQQDQEAPEAEEGD